MEQLTVKTTQETYDVHIGTFAYEKFSTLYRDRLQRADRIAIIADENVAKVHLKTLTDALSFVSDQLLIKTIPSGEASKTMATYSDCQSFLLQNGCTRHSLIIAFGGGACGDLAGFVAASFMRGIPFIQCPTTILAHDSAVGGKTAINMPEGKNMVGAFHQPEAVLFQTPLFSTLPVREIRSGLAELLKHAFISDEQWTIDLLANERFTTPKNDWLAAQLLRGIQVKAEIVGEDEFEQSTRKYLNFGHTFGHAIEAACGFGRLSHGEAVMIGMVYSLLISEQLQHTERALTDQLIAFLKRYDYPLQAIRDYAFDELYIFMQKDKKATDGKVNFVLLNGIGQPFVTSVTKDQCEEAFRQLQQRTE